MRFLYNPGCPCCCSVALTVTVTDCIYTGSFIAGVTLVASQSGQANVTATSGNDGKALLTLTNGGTWLVTATYNPYQPAQTSIDVVCNTVVGLSLCVGDVAVLPGCNCQFTPTTLYMYPTDPSLNNGMFQPCTLAYGDTPPEYARAALGTKSFLSVESFIDSIGESFRYYFTCTSDKFTLTRVYAHSIFGNPYRDAVRYTWPLTLSGNTCSPFLLNSGQIYQGGDTRSQITITPTPR